MKKNPAFPAFGDWTADDKRTLRALAGKTDRFYGYEL
jgi:hypothetical protein